MTLSIPIPLELPQTYFVTTCRQGLSISQTCLSYESVLLESGPSPNLIASWCTEYKSLEDAPLRLIDGIGQKATGSRMLWRWAVPPSSV